MKKPRSTKNKKKNTKFEFNSDSKPKKIIGKFMKEQSEEISDSKSQHFDEEDGNDKIEISSNSEESPKNNAFGFLQMNSLSNNLKERMNETQKAGFISDRNQKNLNLNITSTKGRLKGSHSIGPKGSFEEDNEAVNKDSMVVDKGKSKFTPWESNHDWNNQSLEPNQDVDSRSRITKRSKNSKVGSRDGSRRAKRKIKALVSLQKTRDKTNVSRQGKRKNFKGKKDPVSFDEFKQDGQYNKQIGANNDEIDKNNNQDIDFDPREIVLDESKMDDESFNYAPYERSLSLVEEGQNNQKDEFVQDNPIDIVEQNSFDKLENYKDRLP